MIPEQLDLFGRPPGPPKKILVDDDDVKSGAALPLDTATETETTVALQPAEQPSAEGQAEPELTTDLEGSAIHIQLPAVNAIGLLAGEAEMPEADLNPVLPGETSSDSDISRERVEAVNLEEKNSPHNEPVTNDSSEVVVSFFDTETVEAGQPDASAREEGKPHSQQDNSSTENAPVRADRTPFKAEEGNVPPDDILFRRQYYSMRETSTMLGITQSLLRFWENEFEILRPRKNRKGDRYFRPIDIKNLQLIIHLLKVRRFTLEGAQEYLRTHNKALDNFELIQKLEKLKGFLHELKAHL